MSSGINFSSKETISLEADSSISTKFGIDIFKEVEEKTHILLGSCAHGGKN